MSASIDSVFNTTQKVVIIGSGPAGHTAAIYTGRALLEPVMFEGEMAGGVAAGGQLTTTTEVENFPGFPKGISGPELMMAIREQSVNCGARIFTKTVTKVNLDVRPFEIYIGDNVVKSHTLIIATGATAKRLGAEGESKFWQMGISACAVCDGALPIFRNKPLFVVGGGDTAVEEAEYLSKYGSSVTLLVRRDELRASKVMQERLFANGKVKVMWHTELEECIGDDILTHVKVRNNQSGETQTLEASGLFYAIGHTPNTQFLGDSLEKDEAGYLVLPNLGDPQSSIEGVFACGDVQDKIYRQAITAAGSGCQAALSAERYLAAQGVE